MEHSPISIKNNENPILASEYRLAALALRSQWRWNQVAPCARFSIVSVVASAKAFGSSSAMKKSVRRLSAGAMQRECNAGNYRDYFSVMIAAVPLRRRCGYAYQRCRL